MREEILCAPLEAVRSSRARPGTAQHGPSHPAALWRYMALRSSRLFSRAQLRIIRQTGNDPKRLGMCREVAFGRRLPDSGPNKTAATCWIYDSRTPKSCLVAVE